MALSLTMHPGTDPVLRLRKSVSLRLLGESFRAALETAARLGATAVEINARLDVPLEQVTRTGIRQIRKWLDDFRLDVAIVSYPTRRGLDDPAELDRRVRGLRAAMRFASDLGCRHVSTTLRPIAPDAPTERAGMLQAVLEDLSRASLRAGAWLALRPDGHNGSQLADLLAPFPAGSLAVDFDPATALLAGHDPLEVLRPVATRIAHVRARDAVRDRNLPGGGAEVQLGRGSVDFPALFASLEETSYQGHVTVERLAATDPAIIIRDCSLAMQYLDNLFS